MAHVLARGIRTATIGTGELGDESRKSRGGVHGILVGDIGMLHIVLRRLALAVPLLFLVTALTFLLVALTPGDPAADLLGTLATKAQYAAIDRQMGFDLPVWTQYWHWLDHALRGDLGTSLVSGQPVTAQLDARLPVTVPLVLGATAATALLGVGLGTLSATRGGLAGRCVDTLAMLGFAIPNFWLGLLLVDLFAVRLGWLPATGYVPFGQSPAAWFDSFVLPVATLAVSGVTGIAKQTRDAMRDTLARDFVDAMRADGMPQRRIVRHALKVAALPVVTMIGTFSIGLLGGAVLIESVFALPGLGGEAAAASAAHDLPMIQGVALYFCLAVIVVNLAVDLLCAWLDPKARTA
jgi:peptide/nickel transport system permease protein